MTKPLSTDKLASAACGRSFETLCNRPKGHKGHCYWEPPAAESAPRVPAGEGKCSEPAGHFIAGASWFTCVLPKGHEPSTHPFAVGGHLRGGNCFKHGEYAGDKCPEWPNCLPAAAEPPRVPDAQQVSADELIEECAKEAENWALHYPESVFTPIKDTESLNPKLLPEIITRTSAEMGRRSAKCIAEDIRALKGTRSLALEPCPPWEKWEHADDTVLVNSGRICTVECRRCQCESWLASQRKGEK